MTPKRTAIALLLVLLAAASASALADDSFTATNPSTGQTESVWAASAQNGASSEVFFSVLEGAGWTPSEQLTSNTTGDQNPHLAFSPQGGQRVTWWNDGSVDTVMVRSKDASAGSWGEPVLVSDGIEDARHPRAAVFGGATFIAFEGVPGTGPRKVIVGKWDDPGPIPLTLIGVASRSNPLSVRINSESGRLWVDWVDSGTLLGWSEYVNGAWASVLHEAYSGPSDLSAARERIRSQVIGY
jgi:hypothetical protein